MITEPVEVTAIATIEMEPVPGSPKMAKALGGSLEVKFSPNMDTDALIDDSGNPKNRDCAKMTSMALLNGLMANVHNSHRLDIWDSAEHFRWAIAQMEAMFVEQVEIQKADTL